MVKRFKAFLAQYGVLALLTHYAIFFSVWLGLAFAIRLGLELETAKGSAGALAGAYVVTKITQPARIAATIALTPLLARAFPRLAIPLPMGILSPAPAEERPTDERP